MVKAFQRQQLRKFSMLLHLNSKHCIIISSSKILELILSGSLHSMHNCLHFKHIFQFKVTYLYYKDVNTLLSKTEAQS